MSFNDLMNKIRQWDNATARWLLRHFYFTFFQIVLFGIFLFWFVNMFHVLDISFDMHQKPNLEKILSTQSVNMTIVVFIMLLNSFWMLFMFNFLQRMHFMLKDINYNISRLRQRNIK